MYAHKQPEPTGPRLGHAIVYLIVGLPGAGKTTQAKELEISAPALRLTPDEWQIMLFGRENPPDKRDLVEGKLVQLGRAWDPAAATHGTRREAAALAA
jgi:predicted kinase